MPGSDAGKATNEEHAMRGPRFDPTINLGHVLTATVFLMSAGAAWMNMNARMERAESAIATLKQEAKDSFVTVENRFMREVTTQRAHMDQTQVRVADDIREIKTLMRDGFRDLDSKLDKKVDKTGR
jgi:hypothetical protein